MNKDINYFNLKNYNFDNKIVKLNRENDEGNIEYKWKFNEKKINDNKIEKLISQMRYRIMEGNGAAFYYIGVKDNGNCDGIEWYDLLYTLEIIQIVSNKLCANIEKINLNKQDNNRYCGLIYIIKDDLINTSMFD